MNLNILLYSFIHITYTYIYISNLFGTTIVFFSFSNININYINIVVFICILMEYATYVLYIDFYM